MRHGYSWFSYAAASSWGGGKRMPRIGPDVWSTNMSSCRTIVRQRSSDAAAVRTRTSVGLCASALCACRLVRDACGRMI
eukprot:351058-Chlamydomonas_euryale.AAC.4